MPGDVPVPAFSHTNQASMNETSGSDAYEVLPDRSSLPPPPPVEDDVEVSREMGSERNGDSSKVIKSAFCV